MTKSWCKFQTDFLVEDSVALVDICNIPVVLVQPFTRPFAPLVKTKL